MGGGDDRTYRPTMLDINAHPTVCETWEELGRRLRVGSVRLAAIAGSGHPTSSMSASDLMAVLLAGHLRCDFDRPRHPGNDHLIFSKGHASPLRYAMYRAAGAIQEDELATYRRLGARLEGHRTPRLPWVDVATGSLGLGLPVGVGLALAARLDRLPYRVWVLCGDSELAEGSMWEAFAHAGHARLENLVASVEVNRLGQSGETMLGWDTAARARAFGWLAIEIDGHDVAAIDGAYTEALATDGRPVAILARTVKGRGVAAVADRDGFHGKPLDDPGAAIEELGGLSHRRIAPAPPRAVPDRPRPARAPLRLPEWRVGERVATRRAYREALTAAGDAEPRLIAVDGEVSNSTYSGIFRAAHPDRFIEMCVAEQQMAAAAVGLQARGFIPFASTFAAFWSSAHDFIRMAAISGADIRIVGSHTGVTVGEDGPSQMALEDIAMFRAVPGATVVAAACANQTGQLVAELLDRPGVAYVRTLRMDTPVLYEPGERFTVGGSRTLRTAAGDRVTLLGAGITVHEALAAADELAAAGIGARVLDLYSAKPLDAAAVARAARDTGAVVVAEDHWPEGGLGDAVLGALADAGVRVPVARLAVREVPTSGEPSELLRWAGIDRASIARAARALLRG
jgi:transketolase